MILKLHLFCNQSKINILQDIINRDTNVKKYMYQQLRNGRVPSKGEMDKLFITTSDRTKVKFDLKKQFTIMSREFQEIRDNVHELLKSVKQLKTDVVSYDSLTTRRMRHQCLIKPSKYSTGTCRILVDPTNSLANIWLMIYNPFNKKKHLKIPLQENKYLERFFAKYQLDFNSVKTVHISKIKNEFHIHLTLDQMTQRNPVPHNAQITTYLGKQTSLAQLASLIPLPKKDNIVILGLDPGLRTPYTGCFVTPDFKMNYDFVRYYSIPMYQRKIDILDKKIAKKQRNLNNTKTANRILNNPNHHVRISNITKGLKQSRKIRKKVRKEGEVELAKFMLQDIKLWQQKGWNVIVAVGYPHSVNTFSSKKFNKSRTLRRRASRWNYESRPEIMQKVFASFGIEIVFPTSEEYTSKTCWKCGITEFRNFRKQIHQKQWGKVFRHAGYFKCKQCGWQGNSDLNGAINIAKKYILTELYSPSTSVLTKHSKWKKWNIVQNRFYYNQLSRNKSSMKNGSVRPAKYNTKKFSWNTVKKQKGTNLQWFEYPLDKLKSFKWIKTRPHRPVPRYAELYDKSILCPLP